jgi:DinB superfamily
MLGRPSTDEAAPYYFTYIDQVTGENPFPILENQLEETIALYSSISEEKSLYRYAPGKWSIRQALSHVNDTERVFCIRAMWFARGFDTPLPSFDQDIAVVGAEADRIPLATHVEEFQRVRLATLSLFCNLPREAWTRSGIASEKRFTVRALAFIAAGHVTHHNRIVRERYLDISAAARGLAS